MGSACKCLQHAIFKPGENSDRPLHFKFITKRVRTVCFLCSRGQWKCDGTHVETRFRLSAKRTSPFRPAGASVQSTAGSRGVRISGSNAGYTKF